MFRNRSIFDDSPPRQLVIFDDIVFFFFLFGVLVDVIGFSRGRLG